MKTTLVGESPACGAGYPSALRTSVRVAAATVVAALIGCLPATIHPLYTEKDLTFDPALVGVWSEGPDSADSWTFTKADDRSYRLLMVEDGQTWPFEARLLKLGEQRFLDLFPEDGPLKAKEVGGLYRVALARCHLFLRVDQIEPELKMASMKVDWLENLLKKDPQAISHAVPEKDHIVLTAPTKELQAFLLKHLKTEEAWAETPGYERMTHAAASKPEKPK